MSKYKEIKGFKVQTLSGDTAASQLALGTWSSGGNMNEGRIQGAGSGTQTASIFAGGTSPTTGDVETYNGSSWTEVAELNTARAELASSTVAPSTAMIVFSGHTGTYPTQNNVTSNEYYNGSSWTELADMNVGRRGLGGAGTAYTAALAFGGYRQSSPYIAATTETWNGSSWTEVGDLNTARYYLSGTGSNTAAIAVGGEGGSPVSVRNDTESWNGSAWTEVGDTPVASNYWDVAGASYTDCLAIGGAPGASGTKNIHWDGSSWTELADYSVGRGGGVTTGSSPAALLAGGNPAPVNNSTEEFNTGPADFQPLNLGQVYYNSTANAFKVTKTVLGTGAWASGGTMNTSRKEAMGFGILTANIMAGGNNPSPAVVNNVEQYNGSSWSEITEINTARRNGRGGGTITAGIVFGGIASPGSGTGATETWNGSAWTEVNDMTRPGAQQSFGTAGASSTSALAFGGEPGTTYFAYTETWNGSSWTEVNNLNTGRQGPAGFGIVTAALCAGGYSPPAPPGNVVANVEKFDGTSWTEVNDINTARGSFAGSGSSTSGLIFGGQAPPGKLAQTEAFDGTSFTEVGDLSKGIYEMGYAPLGASPQSNSAAISAGGKSPSPGSVATTEEWTIPSSVVNQTIGSS